MGRIDVDAMLAEMSSADFARWLAFYDLHPWGADADDLRAGAICAAVGNFAGRVRKDGTPPLTHADFFRPRGESAEDPPSVADKLKAQWGDPNRGR